MDKKLLPFSGALVAGTLTCMGLFGCNMAGSGESGGGGDTSSRMLDGTSNYNFSCGGRSGGEARQSPFAQQKEPSCEPSQKISFPAQKVTDFDVDLDCPGKKVIVSNRGASQSQQKQELPIQEDGSVSGNVQFPQPVQDDGKGNKSCWVEYQVSFAGKTKCDAPGGDRNRLTLNTQVAFKKTSAEEVRAMGGQSPGQNPDNGQHPGHPQHPGNGQHPGDGQNPDNGQHPGNGQNPDDGQHPGNGQNPDNGQHPGNGQNPDDGQHPGNGQNPDNGQHPGNGQNPDNGQHPGNGQNPDNGQHPGDDQHPGEVPVLVCQVDNACPVASTTDMGCDD